MIDQPVSRRRFLKLLGTTFALLGGTGLGGLVSGCGKDSLNTNTTATIAAASSTSTTTTTVAPSTTTVTTAAETGRALRIGVISAKTGRLALFGKADDWWMDYALEALPDGILCGDGKLRKVTFMVEDHGSSADGSAKAATRLIGDGRVDLLMCSGAANVVNAAAAQAEALGCPLICDFVPWRPFIFDRGGSLSQPFTWTYAHAFGFEDIQANFLAAWDQVATNKKVGLLLPDDSHGHYWSDPVDGVVPVAEEAGYDSVFAGLYPVSTSDFSSSLAEFKRAGCEICFGYLTPADLTTFWQQAQQAAYQPKIMSAAGALLFPQVVEALGPSAVGMTAESLWQPVWPFRDSITRKSGQDLAIDYLTKTGEQWTVGIGQYAKFEWAVDVFQRVADLVDKRDTLSRVRTTRLNTCAGLIDFTAPVTTGDPDKSFRPVENVYKAPVACCQWTKGTTYTYEPRLVASVTDRDLPADRTLDLMAYDAQS